MEQKTFCLPPVVAKLAEYRIQDMKATGPMDMTMTAETAKAETR